MMGKIHLEMILVALVLWVSGFQLEAAVRFGPYEALTISEDIIRGVKVDDSGKIWLLLNPDYLDKEIILKISNQEGANYRKWHNGQYELVSPAGQDKRPNEWTDWVQTRSRFIEYWMDGNLILHLKKID